MNVNGDVQLGEVYYATLDHGARRRMERVVILYSDATEGWWAYGLTTRRRCHIRSINDLSRTIQCS